LACRQPPPAPRRHLSGAAGGAEDEVMINVR
jgi:hypothetical protein